MIIRKCQNVNMDKTLIGFIHIIYEIKSPMLVHPSTKNLFHFFAEGRAPGAFRQLIDNYRG